MLVADFLPVLAAPSLDDLSAHLWWYLGRSSGFVAFWLMFASVALGLGVSSRVFDGVLGRPWVYELHKFLSVFVLLVMVFHALIMLPDPYAGFSLRELLIPFQSSYRNNAMATGILTLYGSIFISATFYMKPMISQKMWRLIHYLTFALFLSALAHGIYAGTDSGRSVVQFSYLAAAVSVLFLTFFRILAVRSAARPAKGSATVKAASVATGQ
jgi:predicted ferric reductase